MGKTKRNMWTVDFAGDFFTLQTTVVAKEEDEAIASAIELLDEHYGWDMNSISNDINCYEVA